MNFNNFLTLVEEAHNNYKWRYGQSLMNVLHSVDLSKYNELVSTEHDCYYDDRLVGQTLSLLEKEWKF